MEQEQERPKRPETLSLKAPETEKDNQAKRTRHRTSKQTIRSIQSLYKTGNYSIREIADKLGISKQVCHRYCRRVEISSKNLKTIELDRQALIQELKSQEITPKYVVKRLKKLFDSDSKADIKAALTEYNKIMGFYADKETQDKDNVIEEKYHLSLPINPRD